MDEKGRTLTSFASGEPRSRRSRGCGRHNSSNIKHLNSSNIKHLNSSNIKHLNSSNIKHLNSVYQPQSR